MAKWLVEAKVMRKKSQFADSIQFYLSCANLQQQQCLDAVNCKVKTPDTRILVT